MGISVSALNAAQMGLQTTGHNIANANTPGYSRQEVQMAARQPQFTGAGYLGQGADVNTVKRAYSQFLNGQVLTEQSQAAMLNTYHAQIQQIDNVIADPVSGISPAIQDFFGSVNNVANTPESQPARQAMLNSASAMAGRFQSLAQRMTDINDSVSSQISNSIALVNSYSQQIAALNQNIVNLQSGSTQPPNDLLDQRDQLVAQLNTEIKATVVRQVDGAYNVFVGNGQSLVVGSTAFTVAVAQSPTDPSKQDVVYNNVDGTQTTIQQSSLQGGNLGGFLAFRDTTLTNSQNALGRIAMGIAGMLNQQHQLGQDLNGALGGNFFVQPLPTVYGSKLNAGTAVVAATVTNPADYSALTGSDYTLKFDGGTSYTLTRLSDNTQTVYAAGLPATAVDGLTLTSTAGALAGDTYLIRPSVFGARDIAVGVTDPAKIAAGSPIRGNSTLTNLGTGKIGALTVNTPAPPAAPVTPDPAHPLTDLNLKNPITISFTSATTFDVLDTATLLPVTDPTTLLPLTAQTYTSGGSISANGWTTQITGVPRTGDTFTIAPNAGATTDSRNALLMASMQTKNTLGAPAGGTPTMTFQGAYAQWVSDIGNKTRELQVTSTAQTSMAAQTVAAQQSYSGVNLDEEAANLMRYQRAYQAAGKAMQIANTLFDTLLSLGR
jgi:flagellar hook-associated protein 1 FlgK